MAHSLNNHKAADKLKRTGSYSTRGSRRGYVDMGSHIIETDENREALTLQKTKLQHEIAEFRRKYKVPPRTRIHDLKTPTARSTAKQIKQIKLGHIKKRRLYSWQELEHIRECVQKVVALDAQIKKMPRCRSISKNKRERMLDILADRSPELYQALERAAMEEIARLSAQAVRPDELKTS
mgnify:CR=1 FL=1